MIEIPKTIWEWWRFNVIWLSYWRGVWFNRYSPHFRFVIYFARDTELIDDYSNLPATKKLKPIKKWKFQASFNCGF